MCLSDKEIARLYSQVANPGILTPECDLREPLVSQLAYGIVRNVAKSAELTASSLIFPDEPKPSDQIIGQFAIEELMFYLHMIDRTAFVESTFERRRSFMDDLVGATAAVLWSNFAGDSGRQEFAAFFASLYNARQKEYATYEPPRGEKDGSQKGTILWEYGKRMSALITPNKSAMRTVILGNLAMQYLSELIPLVREIAASAPADVRDSDTE